MHGAQQYRRGVIWDAVGAVCHPAVLRRQARSARRHMGGKPDPEPRYATCLWPFYAIGAVARVDFLLWRLFIWRLPVSSICDSYRGGAYRVVGLLLHSAWCAH